MTYIDIETATGYPDWESAPMRVQELFAEKVRFDPAMLAVQSIDNERNFAPVLSKLYQDRAAVLAEFNKIVCVSYGDVSSTYEEVENNMRVEVETIEIKSITNNDELALLLDVAEILQDRYNLCAHFGKGFDYPVLSRKFIMHGLKLPHSLDNAGKKPWEIGLIDTAELWKFGDMKHSASLDLLAHCLGLPSPKAGMHGADVSRVFWNEGEEGLAKIATYCEGDVRTLANVHRRIIGKQIL